MDANEPDTIKDELRVFLETYPQFKEVEDYLPFQRAASVDAINLELRSTKKPHSSLCRMCALIMEHRPSPYHATGTGRTMHKLMDAKSCRGRSTLPRTHELVEQAAFRLWTEAIVGLMWIPLKSRTPM